MFITNKEIKQKFQGFDIVIPPNTQVVEKKSGQGIPYFVVEDVTKVLVANDCCNGETTRRWNGIGRYGLYRTQKTDVSLSILGHSAKYYYIGVLNENVSEI
jgi:hypothetical protein